MIVLGLLASVGLAGGVAVAQAPEPSHELKMSVSPSKAGTKRKPKNVRVKLDVQHSEASKTTVSRIVVAFPKAIAINTKDFDTCTPDELIEKGECPKGSKVGTGGAVAKADAGGGQITVDFDVAFYVGSSKTLTFDVKQKGGNLGATFPVKIGSAGGKFGRKLTIDIPKNLQSPNGVFAYLTELDASLKGTTGKGKKKHGLFEATDCKGGEHDFQTTLTNVANPNPPSKKTTEATDSVRCR